MRPLEKVHPEAGMIDELRKPIFRADAMFPVQAGPDIDCQLTFMGYWLLKREIPEVTILLTGRGNEGDVLFRKSVLINSTRAYIFSTRDLFNVDADKTFVGSIEVEIFSGRNLGYPFPAITLTAVSDDYRSVVHSTGRVYNHAEDFKEHTSRSVAETGFDIYPDASLTPYFAFVNGPGEIADCEVDIELVNHKGLTQSFTVNLGTIPDHATRFVELTEIDVSSLEGQKGTVYIKHKFTSFFPRFICGAVRKVPKRALTLTHTYYDTRAASSSDYFINANADDYHAASTSVPLLPHHEVETKLSIYPIFAPSDMKANFLVYDENGRLLEELEPITFGRGTGVRELKLISSHPSARLCRILINSATEDPNVPTRIKFGLNWMFKDGGLQSNVCFGATPSISSVLARSHARKWCPLFPQDNSSIIISNAGAKRNAQHTAEIKLQAVNTSSDEVFSRTFELPANALIEISQETDKELFEFFRNDTVGWVFLTANNPDMRAWYLNMNNAGIGADHSY